MKLRKLMFGALACLAFAACSDDNDVVNNVNTGADGDADQMVKINIVAPAGTRALDYSAGTDEENKVSSAVFVFFNNGDFVQASHASEIDFTFNNGSANTVSKISQAVVLLNEPKVLPNQVIAILNSSLTKTELNEKKPSLSVLKQMISDCSAVGEGQFVMSNSVWSTNCETTITRDHLVAKNNNKLSGETADKEGEDTPNGKDPDEDDIFQLTPEEEAALEDAAIVNIYVERVLAKVNVVMNATQDKITADDITITGVSGSAGSYTTNAGTLTEIVPVIKGIHLSYASPASYLLKQYSNEGWGGAADAWIDATNFRSYWGKSIPAANWKEGFSTTETNFAWRHKQYSNVKKAEAKGANAVTYEFYTQENTSAASSATTSTKVVITAQLTTDGTTSVGDLVKYKGLYYSEADFLKIAAQKLIDGKFTFKVAVANAASNDWAQYLKSTRVKGEEKDWEIRIVTKFAVDAFAEVAKDGAATTVADINEYLLDEIGRAWEWQDGRCYYYVDVEHINAETAIIRNHVYQLNINAIAGMGTPVYDPDKGEDKDGNPDEDGKPDEDTDNDDDPTDSDGNDDKDPEGGDKDPEGTPDPDDDEDPIIPQRPTEDAFYVSAKLNILKWAIVPAQDVDLQ